MTTTCLLAKVECVGAWAGTVLGFTDLDIDREYDDLEPTGLVNYRSQNGFTPKRVAVTAGLQVDNSEIMGVVAPLGITEEQIRAGIFNSAKLTVYRVNYNDLTAGRHEVVEYGRAGETKYSEIEWSTEFRSLTQLLKQTISQTYSVTCIAKFGSTGVRWACNKALVWTPGTVDGLGTETDRQFTDASIVAADDFYRYGVIRWLTGDNAGAEVEVEGYAVGTFDLQFALPFAVQVGDTYEVRQDCDKTFEYCKTVHNNTDNFRGQNKLPVDGTGMIPGAEIQRA